MRRFLVFLSAYVAVSLHVGPVQAVTGDFVEDFEHPFVGLVVLYDEGGAVTSQCSGSLLSPTVLLTAGHCMAGDPVAARVWFQQDVAEALLRPDPDTGYPHTCAAGSLGQLCATSVELHAYGDGTTYPDNKDAGLVILEQSITMPEYGMLAEPGSLDRLITERGIQETTFTLSGYGLSRLSPLGHTWFGDRLMAEAKLTNLTSANTSGVNLQVNGNGTGKGGACRGDSGGPVFHGQFASNTIVAVTAFGLNQNCRGVDFSYRIDQQVLHDWIRDHVDEEAWSQISVVPL